MAQLVRAIIGPRSHIGNQPPFPCDHCLRARQTGGDDRCFDVSQFDAQAANLHLIVGAAEEENGAVRSPLRQVAGVVEPLARSEGIRNEALRGQILAPQIAARQLHAAQEQPADDARRRRAETIVQHQQARVPNRMADRHRPRSVAGIGRPVAHIDGRFGGAVKIVQLRPYAPMKMIAKVRRQFLTAAEDPSHLHAGRIGRIQKEGEHGWDEVQRRYAMIADQSRNRARIAMCAGRRDDKARAADQRQEEFPHRDVKGRRRLLKDDVLGTDAILALHPQQAVHDRTMGDDDALGIARRSRREDHIGRVCSRRRRERLAPSLRPMRGAEQSIAI